MTYECTLCNDTGWMRTYRYTYEPCICMKGQIEFGILDDDTDGEFDALAGMWEELEEDYDDARYEQQTAGYF